MEWSCNKKGCDHDVAFWFQGGTFSQRCRSIMHRSQLELWFDGNSPKLSRAFCAGVSRRSNEDIANSGLVFKVYLFNFLQALSLCCIRWQPMFARRRLQCLLSVTGECIMCRCLWPSVMFGNKSDGLQIAAPDRTFHGDQASAAETS